MEENWKLKKAGLMFIRYFLASAIVLLTAVSGKAQTTNFLTLCTEAALRTAVGLGGIYQIGNCGSNTLPTISLTAPLVVERDVSLTSTQQVLLNGQSLTRLFVVKPGVRLSLNNILLFSGRHTETNFNDGGIAETAGAGIYNNGGIVTVLNGRFEANSIVGVTGLAGTNDEKNGEDGGDAAGGAIYNLAGQLTISNTVFTGNSVTAGVGGKGGDGSGLFGDNGGNGGSGGAASGAAIYSRGGSVTIFASTFTTNTAVGSAAGAAGLGAGFLGFPGRPGEAGDGVGGAISADGAVIIISGCTFSGNAARAADALAGNPGDSGTGSHVGSKGLNGGDAAGGAVFSSGRSQITNSTFFANLAVAGKGGAGGAAGSIGGADIGFGGDGGDGGNGGSATGGAIESTFQAAIVNCTFSDNGTTPGLPGAGGAATGVGIPGVPGAAGFSSGGAIFGRTGAVEVSNNILANSPLSVGGIADDLGGNLSTDLNPLLTNPTSLRLVNPYLFPLANNGGPTQTMAIATNSPAVNAGVGRYCPPYDQRGSNRVSSCDIGAYELFGGQTLPQIPTNVINGLTISASSNLVTLTWPAGYTNVYLQFATNLLSTNTTWSLAPQSASTNNGLNVVTISTTNTARPRGFFRLFGLTNLVSGTSVLGL